MSSDADLIAGAKAYVDALASHDPSAVPFDPDCVRIEMGVKTGRSGDHLRRSLSQGPQYKVIHAITEFQARVEGRTVHVTFYVNVQPKRLGLRSKVIESFEFDESGQIKKIVAKFGVPHRAR